MRAFTETIKWPEGLRINCYWLKSNKRNLKCKILQKNKMLQYLPLLIGPKDSHNLIDDIVKTCENVETILVL